MGSLCLDQIFVFICNQFEQLRNIGVRRLEKERRYEVRIMEK